jgi:hypothetical protein
MKIENFSFNGLYEIIMLICEVSGVIICCEYTNKFNATFNKTGCLYFCYVTKVFMTRTAESATMASRKSEIALSKCGIRFSPPAIVLTYAKDGKTRRRTMPLRNFNKNSGVQRVAEELRSNTRHRPYLESMPPAQLEKLITMIRDKLNGASKEAVIARAHESDTVDPEEDLNKVLKVN